MNTLLGVLKKWTVSFLSIVLSSFFLFFVYQSNILPTYLFLTIGVCLMAINATVLWFFLKKNHGKLIKVIGALFSVVFLIGLGLSNVMVYQGVDALRAMTQTTVIKDALSVIVLAESKIEEINDSSLVSLGVHSALDIEYSEFALSHIENEVRQIELVSKYADFSLLLDALNRGEVSGIILNESYRSMVEELDHDFSNKTKVIYQVEKKTEVVQKPTPSNDLTSKPFNVYISGIDTYGPIATKSRSDVNMVVSINPITKEVLLTNIPRDYFVPLACQGGAMDKLTHAGVYGVDCSMNTIAQFLDIPIEYYGRINFSSLVNLVDALGGIEVESRYAFNSGGFSFTSGKNYLNGKQALAFSRERYSFSGGDRDRGINQQAVIQGIVNKAMSPSIVSNYTAIMKAIAGTFQTNMSSQDIGKLIQMQLSDMATWTIKTTQLNGSGAMLPTFSYGNQPLYVMIPDQAVVHSVREQIDTVTGASFDYEWN